MCYPSTHQAQLVYKSQYLRTRSLKKKHVIPISILACIQTRCMQIHTLLYYCHAFMQPYMPLYRAKTPTLYLNQHCKLFE